MGNKNNVFKADEDTDEDADLARFVNKICMNDLTTEAELLSEQ